MFSIAVFLSQTLELLLVSLDLSAGWYFVHVLHFRNALSVGNALGCLALAASTLLLAGLAWKPLALCMYVDMCKGERGARVKLGAKPHAHILLCLILDCKKCSRGLVGGKIQVSLENINSGPEVLTREV